MSEAIYSTFGVTFLASPLGEGERTKVRDRSVLRAIALKTLTLPLSALHPVAIPGEATFQCPARVCAAAHALKEMEPVVIALASNERYFPGLYCAVASALRYLDRTREVNLNVLDGGISQTSRDTFSKLIDRVRGVVRPEFVLIDESIFRAAASETSSYRRFGRALCTDLESHCGET